jgi:hypothetical protein
MMALFDVGHRLQLSGGYWLQKTDDNRWQVGAGDVFLGFSLDTNVPVGPGGSFDREANEFAEAMCAAVTKGGSTI